MTIVKRIAALCCLMFVLLNANAQKSMGDLKGNFQRSNNVFRFFTTNGETRIEFCTDDVFRVRTSWDGRFEANEPWMVVKYNWAPVNVTATDKGTAIQLSTAKLSVRINKTPFSVDVYTSGGKLLSAEKNVAEGGSSKQKDTITTTKSLDASEHFFGFGERMDFLDQRSKKLRLNVGRGKGLPHVIGAYNVNEANYSPVPFFMSTKGYGIFFHNSFATTWDMGFSTPGQYSFSADGGEMDYYFMYGPSFPVILDRYTDITGKSPLLPEFALGLHVGTYAGGTWGHEALTSDTYVLALARKFRELGIPVDILHLDSVWRIFGKNGGKGATSFEWRETFKNPRLMFDSLYKMNYKMVGMHIRPRFDNGNTLQLLDTAREKGYVYPEPGNKGEFVNFFDSTSVNWWWNHGVMRIASQGAMFLKTDEGSAFGGLANESDKTGPTDEKARKLHNVFPLAYAKAPYEKFRDFNGIRGMNLTREGYAGIQRYPYIFAGDWPSEWQYFEPVIKAGLNIGVSGVGNWAHCMGGFEHKADPELYIRWCQFGLMSPVAHLFGMDHPDYKEPWRYGDTILNIFKKFDALRYQLTPYLYAASREMYDTGMPLMRALVLHYQHDERVYNITDQYMLGPSLMVCPVTVKGAQTRTVYLPEGEWVNFWTGSRHKGKQYLHVVTPLDEMPMFVKAGAILPMQPPMLYHGEKPVDRVTLHVYDGAPGTYKMYQDDGKSLDYEKGKFAFTGIQLHKEKNTTKLTVNKPSGSFEVPPVKYSLRFYTEVKPLKITLNERVLSDTEWHYDATKKMVVVENAGDNSREINILVQ